MIKSHETVIYIGSVVDIYDPKFANRVRVRIFGLHDVDDTKIDNEDLPWALVNMPVTGSSMTGLGTNHGLKQGSVVTVYFLDGKEQQVPIVMGSISGIQDSKLPKLFDDPDGVFPIEDRLSEPDVNRIARNEKIDETIIQEKRDTVDTGIKVANDGSDWDEPETEHASVYPYNRVLETISGHVVEIDDTEGAERIHIWHTSGTSIEMRADGSIVTRIKKDNYEIIDEDNKIHIKGDSYISVDGNTSLYGMGRLDVEIDDKTLINLHADTEVNIDGNLKATVTGNADVKIDGNYSVKVGGNYSVDVGGVIDYKAGATADYVSGSITTIQGSIVNIN